MQLLRILVHFCNIYIFQQSCDIVTLTTVSVRYGFPLGINIGSLVVSITITVVA